MVFEHILREEASKIGDPEDASVTELTGVAPPCDDCGSKPAVQSADGRDLCGDCHPSDSL